jgi:hypothetical protein
MRRIAFRITIAALSFGLSMHASAWTHSLVKDLGVKGVMRYCQYSNGKVYAVNAVDICKISIEDSAPGFGRGQGFLKGEYQDGMTKVCIYDVLGETKSLRVGGTTICPAAPKF